MKPLTRPIDALLSLSELAQLEGGVTKRTIRNRISAGLFPNPDAVISGRPFWLARTYRHHRERVLAGDFRGRDRIAHLRGDSIP
jgi:hypothetical protein